MAVIGSNLNYLVVEVSYQKISQQLGLWTFVVDISAVGW